MNRGKYEIQKETEYARRVRELFSRIAPSYDFLNHLLSLGQDSSWRRRAARLVCGERRIRVLDVCGGTGDFARQLSRQLPEARIVVADFARPALARAEGKFPASAPPARVECDALQLPFAEKSFDLVACAFGVRNLARVETGIEEFHRELRPNGELLILEFLAARQSLFYKLFKVYFHRVLPWIGGWVSGDREAYKYLPASVERFLSPEEFARLLHRRGFQIKQVRTFSFGVCTLYHARRYLEEGGGRM